MSLPQTQQQIIAELAARLAQHQLDIANARFHGLLGTPSSPLNILANGDSWFDYPLDANERLGTNTDIIAQLPSLCAKTPFITNLANAGDATTVALGYTQAKRMVDAINNPANGDYDAILFSGGGDDIAGDQFCIWLNDATDVGSDSNKAMNVDRFNAILDLVIASYSDLIQLRTDKLGEKVPIFIHAYDFAIPSGKGVYCEGPWLQPSLVYCGWTDLAQNTAIVHNALTQLAIRLRQLANNSTNVIFVETQGTLAASEWANELHPNPSGFKKIAAKFQAALAAKFPGRI